MAKKNAEIASEQLAPSPTRPPRGGGGGRGRGVKRRNALYAGFAPDEGKFKHDTIVKPWPPLSRDDSTVLMQNDAASLLNAESYSFL